MLLEEQEKKGGLVTEVGDEEQENATDRYCVEFK